MATPTTDGARHAVPSRNPLPLSAAQEAKVKLLYHKRIRSYCADEIREFAECVSGRTFSMTWACRQQKHAMNGCMMAHSGREEEDRAREDYFATAIDRKREREEKERKKTEQEKFHREWWESDERERARPKK